ncbi:MAG: hypothetical protein K1X52_10850 [Pyrinomonadaceae bacterium]|nr:hypothetical protein [Pyrinomonadaceae bacterium]
MYKLLPRLFLSAAIVLLAASVSFAQSTAAAKVGSETAKGGFRNEDVIRDKFNAWKTDVDAQAWLREMGYDPAKVASLVASKPHGEKADVEVRISLLQSEPPALAGGQSCNSKAIPQSRKDAEEEARPQSRTSEAPALAGGQSGESEVECREGISIKLVSSNQGFNQIDKRWLAHYARMWKMPADVVEALKLFVGETPPTKPGRSKDRMFLDEIDPKLKDAVIKFFTDNKATIISDLFAGDGEHSAGWVMVAFKPSEKTEWVIRSSKRTVEFYSEGEVGLTRGGNLKIGRITMQRKGGDAGRETAKMLQFKINPVELFNAK